VLEWIVRRLTGEAQAVESPVGSLPAEAEIDISELDLTADQFAELFAITPDSWLAECDMTQEYYAMFGDKVPAELNAQLAALRERLTTA